MFIELHRDGKRILVNTMWISGVSEKSGWIDIGDCGDAVFCDESYEEIVWKIAEGERVMAEEGQKDQEKRPHWSDGLSELRKREVEKLVEELLDGK